MDELELRTRCKMEVAIARVGGGQKITCPLLGLIIRAMPCMRSDLILTKDPLYHS